ncbi:MAG: coproporphyrinogen-III oxidase family protein [Candidatus Krumholzibacteriia bacterium]
MGGDDTTREAADRRGGSLYVHVPFCSSVCRYCHFPRTAAHDPSLRRRLVSAVVRELTLRRADCDVLARGTRPLLTAYVGGGTPSVLEPELFAELLAGTVGTLFTAPDFELTAEANPESFDERVAAAWREAGVQRVGLGVQSLTPVVLRRLGRACDPATARAALVRAVRYFQRVSADWILAPGVTLATLAAELDEALDLGVEHVSLYILEVHAGTPLAGDVAAGRLRLPTERAWEVLYLGAVEHLEARGLRQYEVASFARPGAESRHNGGYWTLRPYLGLGPGAHGYWGRRRYENLRDPSAYCDAVEAGRLPEETVDPLDRRARRLEGLILPLRTADGVPLASLPPGALDLPRGELEGLWRVEGDRLRLTPRGFLRLDALEELLARALG